MHTGESGPDRVPRLASLPEPGARIGQYEIIRELGRGGMGAVYMARDTRLGRLVAIKFLYSNKPEQTERFILEARATARCTHENIVVIHDVGEHAGQPFMVLEHLRGAPLSAQLESGRRLLPAHVVELMVPVVRALVVAHEHSIVHRDLKPDNIFVTESGTVKVLDFGVAKLLQDDAAPSLALVRAVPGAARADVATEPTESTAREHDAALAADARTHAGPEPREHGADAGADAGETGGLDGDTLRELTRRGVLIGTLPYMSPEQWGAGVVDHRTDIWAAGIILYKMLAGAHPLAPREGRELVITGLLEFPMPSIRAACPDLPDELADLVDRCLVKPVARRMGSARELLAALEALAPSRPTRALRSDESPYAGLSAFQEADAHRFFGRTREIGTALARLRDQPLLAIVGPSGVGKSSFVRAGIAPALRHSGERWSRIVIRPGRDPMGALAAALAPLVTAAGTVAGTAAGTSTTAGTPATGTALAGDPTDVAGAQREVRARLCAEPGWLGAVLRARASRRDERVLVFVDQLEELYTLGADPRDRLAFTACLASVADDATSPLRLVLAIRSDFLDHLPEDPHMMAEVTRGLLFLTPPDRHGLRDALIRPAEMAGYQFESGDMVEHMLDHLEHTPGALPLLQFAASQLWEMRDAARRILTADSYERVGGVAGALATHADAALARFPAREQALVRALFLRLITPERTRAVVPVAELAELSRSEVDVRRVVDRLAQARLLVTRTGADAGPVRGDAGGDDAGDATMGASVELVHESLIHSWPTLRRWLDENQEDAVFLDQLRNAARQWHARSRPAGLLWRGEAMEEARLWHRRYRGELPALQCEYLDAVFALADRSARRRRVAIAATIGLLSILVAAAAVALFLIQNAQVEAMQQAERAEQQSTLTQRAETARDEATTAAHQAQQTVNLRERELEEKNQELRAALANAERERANAERAERRARGAQRAAEANAAEARRAEAEAVAAEQKWQALHAKEKARADSLEQRGTILVEDIAVKRRDAPE